MRTIPAHRRMAFLLVPLLCATVACGLLMCGCSSGPGESSLMVFGMGERASVGALTFTVLDFEWQAQLGEVENARHPEQRFLIVHLTVTNGGASESAIPPMRLVSASGEEFDEVTNGEGVPQWLGMLRRIGPVETLQGRVIFDAPRGGYRLRVSDDAIEPEEEQAALIELPLQFETGTRILPEKK